MKRRKAKKDDPPELKPGLRIEGSRRTNLKRIAERKAATKKPTPAPVEDERVAKAWERQERRDISVAKRSAERKAMKEEAQRPRQEKRVEDVDNPYFSADHPAGPTNPKMVAATVNIRESAIATLAAKRLLNKAQVQAANRFRSVWERAGGAGVGAVDYTRDHVDGGGAMDPINSGKIDAGKELNACKTLLGIGYEVVRKVCGEGVALGDLSPERRGRDTAADILRMGLDTLAEHWGFASRPSRRDGVIEQRYSRIR